MKRSFFFTIGLIVFFSIGGAAQTNINYNIKHSSLYEAMQAELNNLAKEWQANLNEKKNEITALEKLYESENGCLTDLEKNKIREELVLKSIEIDLLQTHWFGPNGLL